MGKWIHKLSDINEDSRTAVCAECGPVGVRKKSRTRWKCSRADNIRNEARKHPYRRHKKDACDRCGFIPEHSCQLDVDHIDGNKLNNSTENLQTLCANCHRLKTFNSKNWEIRYTMSGV